MKKKNKQFKQNNFQATRSIQPKAMARTRADVMVWKNALAMAQHIENPKMFPYYNLVADMMLDAHATSQIQNRKQKTILTNFSIKKTSGETHKELTTLLQKSHWFNEIISQILDSQFFGYTLIEFNRTEDNLLVDLVPRQNVLPQRESSLRIIQTIKVLITSMLQNTALGY